MLGSQEKILEPKVNVKFFTVDPYTPCNRVSRPFPIWSIWQLWPLLGQKNMFFGGLVKTGNQIWIVFGWFQGFFGPSEWFLEVSEGFKIFKSEFCKQEQIVLERSARLNLDPGRGDNGDTGDGLSFARAWSLLMIICKKPVPPNDQLQEAGPSKW